ncbi:hypothetical protein BDU57DRAFT_436789 [Ampelomyces quisqualis]|uniref:Rhodopsin domain-containing protein n=1 Tax=Ampelomyces quisqualis TaxID=50730 RepID=A0A6A5R2S4_AMPQU|nr:hypothetical protein BDU57DRAFT_436789 [Ampelomyces quisqualis]
MPSFEDMLLAALQNPPDPHEPLPPVNRKATIFGVVIPFLVLAWIAVLFRLWVRLRVVKEPGFDDAFVLLSAILGIGGTTCVCLSVKYGLGHHMLDLGPDKMEKYFIIFYIENSVYLMQTAAIKISLLLQFLRIFKAGAMRRVCLTLLSIVTLWGLAFAFAGWFPCFPVRGAWQHRIGAKCYGFGLSDVQEFFIMYKIHSASNMVLDFMIFMTPMVIFKTPTLKVKNLLAMAGVFAFGGIVVAASIWRLHAISTAQAATHPYVDLTWLSPVIVILSCLEVDFAIICASMPIFWPIIERSLAAIFVSYEVDVTEEHIQNDYGLAYELEHTKSARQTSLRSVSGTSLEGLTGDYANKAPKFSIGPDPLNETSSRDATFQASVRTLPKPKWEI